MSSNVHQLPPRKPTFFRELDVRHKQLYGALCVRRFCSKYDISHEHVDELLQHLVSLLIDKDYGEWEQKLCGLTLCGRGEPIPFEVDQRVDAPLKRDFHALIDYCVEIGITGPHTKYPDESAEECTDILRRNNIEPPEKGIFIHALEGGPRGKEWGEPVSPQIFRQLKALVWDN